MINDYDLVSNIKDYFINDFKIEDIKKVLNELYNINNFDYYTKITYKALIIVFVFALILSFFEKKEPDMMDLLREISKNTKNTNDKLDDFKIENNFIDKDDEN